MLELFGCKYLNSLKFNIVSNENFKGESTENLYCQKSLPANLLEVWHGPISYNICLLYLVLHQYALWHITLTTQPNPCNMTLTQTKIIQPFQANPCNSLCVILKVNIKTSDKRRTITVKVFTPSSRFNLIQIKHCSHDVSIVKALTHTWHV